ncbi:membrane protein insertase YidC [Candidatus Uhrbacteria bacterium]|nr:membrane protein insertase YidC [Candidatus Uhrbacteria bacterium]
MFTTIFTQPIFNLLVFLYDAVPGHSIGIAIIGLTVVVKLVLWPLSMKALRSQKALTDLQPKVEELKKKYGSNKEEHAKALMALYSAEKVSPTSSCLPVLVQLPIFIALYQALVQGLKSDGFQMLYPFVANPGTIDTHFLNLDLAVPNGLLAVLSGITQYFQAKMMATSRPPRGTPGSADEDTLAVMNKQMLYMMPVMTVFIGWSLPGGLALYWLTTNALAVAQQMVFLRNGKIKKAEGGL